MSDVSRGPGWWQASDGKWYTPELHPDYQAPDVSRGPGWWQASDGNWYAPELHPDYWRTETPTTPAQAIQVPAAVTLGTADELAKLAQLRDSGAFTEDEFQLSKAQLLGQRTAPSFDRPPNGVAAPVIKTTRTLKQVGYLTIFLLVAVVVVIVVIVSAPGGGDRKANVTPKVVNVVPLDANTVRIYIDWTNSGDASGSANCVMKTTVTDQFGDRVNIEINSTDTNGNVGPGQTKNLYQDLEVNHEDAQYIAPSDIKFVSC